MRKILIPHDVTVTNAKNGTSELFPFRRFAGFVWFDDAKWFTPKQNLANLVRVRQAFDAPTAEGAIVLEEGDYDMLVHVLDHPQMLQSGVPQHWLSPQQMLECSSYEEAVRTASKIEVFEGGKP